MPTRAEILAGIAAKSPKASDDKVVDTSDRDRASERKGKKTTKVRKGSNKTASHLKQIKHLSKRATKLRSQADKIDRKVDQVRKQLRRDCTHENAELRNQDDPVYTYDCMICGAEWDED